jgi:hypothetical protein
MLEQHRTTGMSLLPGEVADSNDPEDVEHWVAVYRELTAFLVDSDTDDGTRLRFRVRLDHWRRRLDELRGAC